MTDQHLPFCVQELSLDCFKPANGETCTIVTQPTIAADVALPLLKRDLQPCAEIGDLRVKRRKLLHGVLVVKGNVSGRGRRGRGGEAGMKGAW